MAACIDCSMVTRRPRIAPNGSSVSHWLERSCASRTCVWATTAGSCPAARTMVASARSPLSLRSSLLWMPSPFTPAPGLPVEPAPPSPPKGGDCRRWPSLRRRRRQRAPRGTPPTRRIHGRDYPRQLKKTERLPCRITFAPPCRRSALVSSL